MEGEQSRPTAAERRQAIGKGACPDGPWPRPSTGSGSEFGFELRAKLEERRVAALRDVAGFDRGPQRAARLRLVAAIGEAAGPEISAELGVGLLEVTRSDAPQPEGANAGRVDQLEARFGEQKPRRRRGVPALPRLHVDVAGHQVEALRQRVQHRALADARVTDEETPPSLARVADRADTHAALRAHAMAGITGPRVVVEKALRVAVVVEIALVDDQSRREPGMLGLRQHAVDEAGTEFGTRDRGDQHDLIEVRGHDLLDRTLAGGATREGVAPRQNLGNDGLRLAGAAHAVADHDGIAERLVAPHQTRADARLTHASVVQQHD